jgi:hypothetical protein
MAAVASFETVIIAYHIQDYSATAKLFYFYRMRDQVSLCYKEKAHTINVILTLAAGLAQFL